MQGGCISSLARSDVHIWGGGTSLDAKGLRGEETAGRVVSRSLTLVPSSPRFGVESMVRMILEQVFTLPRRASPGDPVRGQRVGDPRTGMRRLRTGRSSGAPPASVRRRARAPHRATRA